MGREEDEQMRGCDRDSECTTVPVWRKLQKHAVFGSGTSLGLFFGTYLAFLAMFALGPVSVSGYVRQK